ncbi:MAG: hypothetical protein JST44_01990 [Cyanobacteria bacterium SZAS LIN-5]|nr:hypothetical protein [Cyanobacteria bacterium SZAS LIN-5]
MTSDGVRLGDLLTGAGLLQASDLREAMMISKQQGLPVGRVLIMSGYLTEQHLQAAVQAQSLLKDGLIEFDLVIKALTMVGTEDITLEEAFKRLKWNQQSDAVTNKLGELLLAADIVPIDALNAALLQCQSIGLPLGRVLVGNGNLTEQMLTAVLNAQVFIRDKKLTREQAIQGLRSAKERQIPIEQYLAETGALSLPTAETVRLGELFVMAGLVDEQALMSAVEVGLLQEQPVGQVLLQTNLITQELLDAALDLQAMVGAGAIKKDEAAKFLGTVKQKKVSVGEAIAISHQKPSKKKSAAPAPPEEPPMPAIEPLHLYQFLQLSGIITAKDIEQAIRVGSKDTAIMAKMLRLSGVMDSALVDAAEKCNDLITSGVLNHEQGMIVLKNCERNNFTLEQAFNELGWNTAPLRADPGVPEALIETPEPRTAETPTDTTAQMLEAQAGANQPKTAENPDTTAQSIPAAEPVAQAAQTGAAEATAPAFSPAGTPDAGAQTSNPFDQGAAANAKAQADALAEFGSSINQPQFAQQQPQQAPAAFSAPAPDLTNAGADAWHSPSPDEWMPKPSDVQQAEAPPAQAAQPAQSDTWQSVGQAQMTADAWQSGQAQQGQQPPQAPQPPQQAPQPQMQPPQQAQQPAFSAPATPGPATGVPSAASDWQSTSSQEWPVHEQAAQPAQNQAPAEWNQAAGASDWAAPAAPGQPQPAAGEWAGSTPAPSAPSQNEWAQSSEQADWAAPQPASQSEWEAQAPQPQPEWGSTTAPAVASEWAAPPQQQPPQAPQQQPPQAPQQPAPPQQQGDWAASSSQSMPAMQSDWANQQQPQQQQPQQQAAPAPTEWQPPTSAAPQESAWGAPPDMPAQAPAQPNWQAAAPSPLPGWQSPSATNQEAWQPMPNSPAAQMFQEAAQSLQGGPPEAQPPQAEPAASQGPMDLFSDGEEEHAEQQDKPKKRLSDLMPKLGPKI